VQEERTAGPPDGLQFFGCQATFALLSSGLPSALYFRGFLTPYESVEQFELGSAESGDANGQEGEHAAQRLHQEILKEDEKVVAQLSESHVRRMARNSSGVKRS
jgi:hypothetical protein